MFTNEQNDKQVYSTVAWMLVTEHPQMEYLTNQKRNNEHVIYNKAVKIAIWGNLAVNPTLSTYIDFCKS